MAKKRVPIGQNSKAERRPKGPVAAGGNQQKRGKQAANSNTDHGEVDSYIDVERSRGTINGDQRRKFGPRAIDPGLIVAPKDRGMSITMALITSIQEQSKAAKRVLSDMGGYAGELNVGKGLLSEFAVLLGVENYGHDKESRERGQPMCVPWGHVLAVRGLLGHFSPALEDRDDWPEPVVATRGLTCADILLGPLPAEFGYVRSIRLLDWARNAIESPPAVVGVDGTAAEEEFDTPYRLTVFMAVRFHLARLIVWIEERVESFLELAVPMLTLTSAGVEVRIAGVSQMRSLGDSVEPFLTGLLNKGKATAEAKTKFDLVAKIPELRPFITVATERDTAGMTKYRLDTIVRRKAGAL